MKNNETRPGIKADVMGVYVRAFKSSAFVSNTDAIKAELEAAVREVGGLPVNFKLVRSRDGFPIGYEVGGMLEPK